MNFFGFNIAAFRLGTKEPVLVDVRFMKRVNGGKGLQYEWPDEEDRSWVDFDDLVCELQIPDPINSRNKWKFSELKTKDNNKVSRILGKMAFQLK